MDILDKLFIQILNMSISATYVIGVVLLLRLLLRRLPKSYSYVLWGIVGLRLLCPFSISSVFSLFNLKPFMTVASGESRAMEYIPADIGFAKVPQINTGIPMVNQAVNGSLPEATFTASVNPMQILLFIGSRIWLFGILALLLYMLLSYLKMKKQVKYAVLLPGSENSSHRIYECDGIKTPFVLGMFRPCVYIPFHLEEKEREYILAHENYHIRRGDPVVRAGAFLLASVYWFHPLVWLSCYLMGKDMEMSCDEKVLRKMGDGIKQDYSNSLLSFATKKSLQLNGPLAFGESLAGKRIKNVLSYKRPAVWVGILCVLLIAVVSLVCLTDRQERGAASGELTEVGDVSGKDLQDAENSNGQSGDGLDSIVQGSEEQGVDESNNSAQSDNDQTITALPTLWSVMDRVFEHCWDTDKILDFGAPLPDQEGEYMVRLAQTADGLYEAYGCISPEYGCAGIYMNYCMDGYPNINYLEDSWMNYFDAPQLHAADYDDDGRDEVALVYLWGEGTGVYVEQLIVFETFETAHMEPFYFTAEIQEEERAKVLTVEAHPENMTVEILSLPEQKTLAEGISYDWTGEGKSKFEGVVFSDQVRFQLSDDKIYMINDIGIATDDLAIFNYNGNKMQFEVEYQLDTRLDSWPQTVFSLKEPTYIR